jgi:hypothetical protein
VLHERLIQTNSGKHSAESVAKASGEAAEHEVAGRKCK